MATDVVKTALGTLRGAQQGDAVAFLGIPYGASTAASGRFRPPQPAPPWPGVRDATEYGSSSPQPALGGPAIPDEFLLGMGILPREPKQGEDCLVLNVWTPGAGDGPRRPVLVWFHGGGFNIGSGSWPWYDGAALAVRGDVVVVTVNHRLGYLGFLHIGDLAGPGYEASGNAGMLDHIAALEWVRDNIEAFGGDPANVTVFGESGGSMRCTYLLAMPAARGLFHKAVLQSGAGLHLGSLDASTAAARAFVDRWGGDVEELLTCPVERFVDAVSGRDGGGRPELVTPGVLPVLDRVTFPEQPIDAVAAGSAAGIPVLVGTTRDEMLSLMPPAADADLDAVLAAVARMVGDDAGRIVEAYRRVRPRLSPPELQVAITTDLAMRIPTDRLAAALHRAGSPVFTYLWAWESPAHGGKAAHGMDVPFWFANLHKARALGDAGAPLSGTMAGALTRFARSGDPGDTGTLPWDPYDPDRRATMVFADDSRVEDDPLGDTRAIWDTVDTALLGIRRA